MGALPSMPSESWIEAEPLGRRKASRNHAGHWWTGGRRDDEDDEVVTSSFEKELLF